MSETTAAPLRTVPLHDTHVALGAKIVPFAGYQMPVRYSSDIEEHNTVRRGVGIFDVSHMGEFRVSGPGAFDLVQRVTSNDVAALTDGKIQYSCLPNETGGIVDDLLVYRMREDEYFLVVNASNIDKDWAWISARNTGGARMENVSDDLALFAVQGPRAVAALQSLTSEALSAITYYTFRVGTFAGVDDVIISATGYTGSGGFELYIPAARATEVWEKILAAGAAEGLKPIGLGARDTLRLEMGFCLYGNDIDDTTSPLEAGLGWITKFAPGNDFTNRPALEEQKKNGLTRKLVAFEMRETGIPRAHYPLTDPDGNAIGEVTSGTQSPSLGRGIGMGYVKTEFSKPGTEICVQVRGRSLKAEVVKLPFWKG